MAIAFRLRRPIGGSSLRGGHTLRGPLEPVPPAPAPTPTIEECVNLSLALVSFLQAPSGFVAEENGLNLEDMAVSIFLSPSGFMNILVVIAASGFLADPDTSSLALEDLIRERTPTSPSGYATPEVIAIPSGFVRDPSVSKPNLWDL